MAKKAAVKETKSASAEEKKRIGLREIADAVARYHQGVAKAEVTNIVRDALDVIHRNLAAKNTVVITGSFALEPVLRPERIGRNPQKPSEPVTIPEHWSVRLKLGKSLKEEINY